MKIWDNNPLYFHVVNFLYYMLWLQVYFKYVEAPSSYSISPLVCAHNTSWPWLFLPYLKLIPTVTPITWIRISFRFAKVPFTLFYLAIFTTYWSLYHARVRQDALFAMTYYIYVRPLWFSYLNIRRCPFNLARPSTHIATRAVEFPLVLVLHAARFTLSDKFL